MFSLLELRPDCPFPQNRIRRYAQILVSILATLTATTAIARTVHAQGPPLGYYASVDTSSPAALRQTVHAVINDHIRYPYTSTNTDTWNILEPADHEPANSANILEARNNA